MLTTPTEAPSQLSVAQSCIKFGATSYNTLLTITHSGILLGRVAVFPAKGSGYPASLPASTFLAFFNVGFDTGVKQLAADPNKAYFIAASDSGGPAFGESFWFAWAPVTANDPTAVEVVVKKCP